MDKRQGWVLVKQAESEDSIVKSSDSDESDDSISIVHLTDSPSEEDESAPHQKELQDIESISSETYHQHERDAALTENPHAQPISCECSTIEEEPDKPEEAILRPNKDVISSVEKAEDLMDSKEPTSVVVLEESIHHMKGVAKCQSVSDEYQHAQTTASDQNGACEGKLMQPELEAQEGPRGKEERSHKEADLKVKLTQHVDSLVVGDILDRSPFTITTVIPQDPAPLLEESGIDMRTGMYLAVNPEPATAQADSNPEKIVETFAETPLGLQPVKSAAPSEQSILDNKLLDHSSVGLLSSTIKERSITDKRVIPARRSSLCCSKRCKIKATRTCFITDKAPSKEYKTSHGSRATNISNRASKAKHLKRNKGGFDLNNYPNLVPCIIGLTFMILILEVYVLDAARASRDRPKQEKNVIFDSSTARRIKVFDKMDRLVPNDWAFNQPGRLKQRNKLRYRLRNFC
ncbi:uncharacterized protein LOC109541179 [Dendroctonus ponderosae]|uniref:uncharacterized protein LOC109541179 n=1 Tax=Dendroctonus ponderosae TaxID=77166 RepID=UPI00203648CF|nr:uncharacterized protein LOC109541179 [Dendroctonus ponderosae]XP_019765523.2 uncharacterized protein LOC109541179 [Dendroctonus ponderosae]XP_019765524.2 uncharacterized protein LOC109541179 [Dendroctonus ponderosae]KAH1029865.1 hypothetical protein HUJ05_003021 [Dendroctonus ponderosae]KAH1029866.1 hypothetical protein HUJ05_003021 [Dendroctonus ponderosae]